LFYYQSYCLQSKTFAINNQHEPISAAFILHDQATFTAAGADVLGTCLQAHQCSTSDMVCVLAVYCSPSRGRIADIQYGMQVVVQQLPICNRTTMLALTLAPRPSAMLLG